MCNTHHVTVDDRSVRERAGQWLRAARQNAGYETAGAFGAAIGAHAASVSAYEIGKQSVPDSRVDDIARALRMATIDVRRGLGLWVPDNLEPRAMTPEEAINADDNLSGEQRILLLDVLASVRRLSQPAR